jgi:molybdopterin molybdotransferase
MIVSRMRVRYALVVTGLLTVEEAQALVLARAHPPAAELVSVWSAAGRVTACDARAAVDLPPFASSAMDGFAVRAADLPGRLAVVDRSAAGTPAARPLGQGEAIEISTGAVVPCGADAVVPIEYVVKNDNEIEVAERPAVGAHIRPRGGDVAAGDALVSAGVRLGPTQLGALAAGGVAELDCAPRPRVAILATGSELVRPGTALAPGQIYESNGLMLAAALAAEGADIEQLPAVADDESDHRKALERGLTADVLVTSGGVSVGPHDLVRQIEAELGVEEVFWRVAVRPGKPVSFGVRGRTLVFGLPGNPVSSLVGCELFVKPALRALQGVLDPLPRLGVGRLASALARNEARDEFVRARSHLDRDGVVLEPLAGQESHMIARAAAADALVHVPRGNGAMEAGAAARWIRLGFDS